MSLCKDCVTGVRWHGTPEGKIGKIGGIDSYIATPSTDYPKDAAIIFLTDVFGYTMPNAQLLADDFANNGFKVIIPDMFNGDAIPPEVMAGGVIAPGFSIEEWLSRHSTALVKPLLDSVVDALQDEGITKLAFAGYCYGARLAFDFAFEGKAKITVVSHPSFLKTPDDFEKYKAIVTAPLLINSCEFDPQFPVEKHAQVDAVMEGFAPGYKREYFEGCRHGWAVRGDISDPVVKAGKERAFLSTVQWFLEHMK